MSCYWPAGRPAGRVRLAGVFALAALVYTGAGFLPGRVLLPLDLESDFGAWKRDPARRQVVSNRLLSDVVLSFVPWDVEARRLLGEGRMPWVNRWTGEGGPLFANPTAALLSPFTWPRLVLGLKGWSLSVFLRLFCAGLGAWWLAREMGARGWEPILSGLVYLGSGFSIVWGMHAQANVIAVLPALAAAFLRLLRRGAGSGAVLTIAGLAAAAMAGGHPQLLAIGTVGLAVWLTLEVAALRRSRPGAAPLARWGLAAAAAGFALPAVQVVPFLHLLAGSWVVGLRSQAPPAAARIWSIVGQFLPGALGGPLGGELDLAAALPGSGSFLTRSEGYVGLVVLVALLAAWRGLPAIFRRGLAVGGVALVLAWCPPVVTAAWRRLPFFGVMGEHYCFFVFVLFAALAAGPAIAALAARPAGRTRVLAWGLLCGGFALLAAGLAASLPGGDTLLRSGARRGVAALRARGVLKNPDAVYAARLEEYLREGRATAARRVALPGLCCAAAGAGLLVSRRRLAILGLAACGELAAFGAGYFPALDARDVPREPPAVRDLARVDPDRRFLFASFPGLYPPNLATLERLRDIRRNDELESRAWALAREADGYSREALAFTEPLPPEAVGRLAAIGVRYYLARGPAAGSRRVGGEEPPAVGLYEVSDAAPRPLPENRPPEGLGEGLAASAAALAVTVLLAVRAGGSAGGGTPSGHAGGSAAHGG